MTGFSEYLQGHTTLLCLLLSTEFCMGRAAQRDTCFERIYQVPFPIQLLIWDGGMGLAGPI